MNRIYLKNPSPLRGDDCMDAGDTSPWKGEVDRAGSWRSRTTPGAVVEGRVRGKTLSRCYPATLSPALSLKGEGVFNMASGIAKLVLLASLVALAAGCGKKEVDKPIEKFVNVTTAVAVRKDLPIAESAVGSTTSLSVVQALDPNSVRRGTLTIRLPFPEHVARQLRIGQSVRLTSFDDASKAATAQVKEIRPALNSSTQTMEVIAELPAGHAWYSIGSVRGEVVVNVHRGAIVIPEQSAVLRPAGSVVYVLEGDSVRERAVQTGLLRNGEIEILAGLKAGETVVVDGAGMLTDGTKIKLRETATAGAAKP
mgnify:CR=1 FL=1